MPFTPSRLTIKICGITSLEDAQAAVNAGADMLGFNFYPASPRYITPTACRKIISALNKLLGKVNKVGIFVNSDSSQIKKIIEECDLDLAQLSGDESEDALDQLNGRGYKALHVLDDRQLRLALRRYRPRASPPAYLIDAHSPNVYGGTGMIADWHLAAKLASEAPILLAGGLTPDNVTQAVRLVKPWGMDVASGVESAPGVKDFEKMCLFIQRARGVNTNCEQMNQV